MDGAWMNVDTAVVVPMNVLPMVASADGTTRVTDFVYNYTGIKVYWCFTTTAGAYSIVEIHPTTGGVHDITEPMADIAMYGIEIPASGGDHASNDTEGFGFITGWATGVLQFRGPMIGFRAATLNDALINNGTIAEMSQGAPPAAPTFIQAINYLYRKFRNKNETTTTENKVYDDAGTTVLFKETHSDVAGTFTKGKFGTGA